MISVTTMTATSSLLTLSPSFRQRLHKRTTGKSERFDLPIALNTIDPRTGAPTNWDSVRHLYPGVTFPVYADTKWEYDKKQHAR
jgi:hypothetical protein